MKEVAPKNEAASPTDASQSNPAQPGPRSTPELEDYERLPTQPFHAETVRQRLAEAEPACPAPPSPTPRQTFDSSRVTESSRLFDTLTSPVPSSSSRGHLKGARERQDQEPESPDWEPLLKWAGILSGVAVLIALTLLWLHR